MEPGPEELLWMPRPDASPVAEAGPVAVQVCARLNWLPMLTDLLAAPTLERELRGDGCGLQCTRTCGLWLAVMMLLAPMEKMLRRGEVRERTRKRGTVERGRRSGEEKDREREVPGLVCRLWWVVDFNG